MFYYHNVEGLRLWCLMPLQQYFSYIVAVSFIGGGKRSTRRNPLTCRKSLTGHLGLIWHVIWKMPYHNLFIIYFNASFFIYVRAGRFQKPCSWIWDMMQWCHIISTFLLYVLRDIILIQLHFIYNNTRWFNFWFIKECHHSLHNEHFPCFLRNPLWQYQTTPTEVNNDTLITKTERTGKREFRKKKNCFPKKTK